MEPRFVEPLLLGLPVRSMFLSKEAETQKLRVIDGQQRLRILTYFCEGLWARNAKGICTQRSAFPRLMLLADTYSRPMNGFLNSFIGRHQHLSRITGEALREAFVPAIEAINRAIGKRDFRLAQVMNAAVFDAEMVGVARQLNTGPIFDLQQLSEVKRILASSKTRHFLAVAERATADAEAWRPGSD